MNADAAGLAAPARLDFLDGLRGWASVMVLLSHVWGQYARHVSTAYDSGPMRIASDGHLAVLIFFVLSGVALSLRFVRRPQPVRLVPLVAARYVRLVIPIAVTTLIVWALLAGHVAGSVKAGLLGSSEIFLGPRFDMSSSFIQAMSFSFFGVLFDYDAHATFNHSLWTMPVEFLGSLMVFALLFVFASAPLQRVGAAWRGLAAAGLALALLLLAKPLAACFAAGYVVAELVCKPLVSRRMLQFAAIALCLIASVLAHGQGLMDDTSGMLVALGIVLGVAFVPAARAAMSSKLSRWLGQVSFPLYLVHVPVIGCAGWLFVALLHAGAAQQWAVHLTVLAAVAASFFCAWLLMPLERLSIRASHQVGRIGLARVPAARAATESVMVAAAIAQPLHAVQALQSLPTADAARVDS